LPRRVQISFQNFRQKLFELRSKNTAKDFLLLSLIMSPVQNKIYLVIFSLILITSFFAIFKLIQQNKLYSQSISKPIIAPLETQKINWERAEQLMSECQIKSVFQKHDLSVTMRGHDNQIYGTTQNKIDDIFKLAKKYQGPCDIIQMISE